MKKYIVPIILVVVAGLVYLYGMISPQEAEVLESASEQESAQEMMIDSQSESVLTANLSDVSGGNAEGTAIADYVGGAYMMTAEFENLPELEDGFFYEGWVVRQGADMSVISSGATQVQADGTHLNIFESPDDLTDHTFYVLTLEPDDGDPAPAEHILEGYFE